MNGHALAVVSLLLPTPIQSRSCSLQSSDWAVIAEHEVVFEPFANASERQEIAFARCGFHARFRFPSTIDVNASPRATVKLKIMRQPQDAKNCWVAQYP